MYPELRPEDRPSGCHARAVLGNELLDGDPEMLCGATDVAVLRHRPDGMARLAVPVSARRCSKVLRPVPVLALPGVAELQCAPVTTGDVLIVAHQFEMLDRDAASDSTQVIRHKISRKDGAEMRCQRDAVHIPLSAVDRGLGVAGLHDAGTGPHGRAVAFGANDPSRRRHEGAADIRVQWDDSVSHPLSIVYEG